MVDYSETLQVYGIKFGIYSTLTEYMEIIHVLEVKVIL